MPITLPIKRALQGPTTNATPAGNAAAATPLPVGATPAYNATASGGTMAALPVGPAPVLGPGRTIPVLNGTTPTAPTPAAAPPRDYDAEGKAKVDKGLADGTKWAETVLPDGTLARLDSPEIQSYMTDLKARTSGMTKEEMRAQYEQGIASSDGELATNMTRASRIAGNAGVRGGAAAGLQADALNHSIDQQAAMQRQLVLDNIAQKNGAFAAYGDNLLGISKYNGEKSDKERLGRVDLATGYSGMVDSAATGLKADDTAAESTKTAKDFADKILAITGKGAGNATTPGRTDAQTSEATNGVQSTVGSLFQKRKEEMSGAGAVASQFSSTPAEIDAGINEYLGTTYPDLTDTERKAKFAQVKQSAEIQTALGMPLDLTKSVQDLHLTPEQAQKYGQINLNRTLGKPDGATIICTEAMRQGKYSRELYPSAARAHQELGYSTMRNYHTWGQHVVKAMRSSPALTSALAWFLPETIAAIHKQPHTFRGDVGLAVFRTLNLLVKTLRKVV